MTFFLLPYYFVIDFWYFFFVAKKKIAALFTQLRFLINFLRLFSTEFPNQINVKHFFDVVKSVQWLFIPRFDRGKFSSAAKTVEIFMLLGARKGFLFVTDWQERKKGTESERDLRKMLYVPYGIFSQWKNCCVQRAKASVRGRESFGCIGVGTELHVQRAGRKQKNIFYRASTFHDEINW